MRNSDSESGYRKIRVHTQKKYCGILEETDKGYRFTYDEAYLSGEHPIAVSITLPLSKFPYESKVLFPFFDGLIPEGWMLEIAVHSWKINPKDRFGILMRACHDCIGDVELYAEDEI